MNVLPSSEPRRVPWFRIAAAVWLLALSTGLVVVIQDVRGLSAPPAPSPQAVQIEALTARLDQAEQQLVVIKRQPPVLTPEALATVRKELEDRLAQIDVALAIRNDDQVLQALVKRVEKLEASPPPAKLTTQAPRPKAAAAKPAKQLQPPFQVLGVEQRGGERFLTVVPLDATSLDQLRLLREGESEAGWTLESIGTKRAMFQVKGKTQQLAVP